VKLVSDVVKKTSIRRQSRISYAAIKFFCRRWMEDKKLHENST